MFQQLINWITGWSGEVAVALIGLLGGLAGFALWDRRLKTLQIEKLRLEIESLRREQKPLIYKPTPEEIDRIIREHRAEVIQNRAKLSDLLIGKEIDEIRILFDLWIEMVKVGGEKTGDIFNAYESLAASAKAKGIKLELKLMTNLICIKETVSHEDMSITMQMSGEAVLCYIHKLDELIKTDQIDQYNIVQQTEQVGLSCLLDSMVD